MKVDQFLGKSCYNFRMLGRAHARGTDRGESDDHGDVARDVDESINAGLVFTLAVIRPPPGWLTLGLDTHPLSHGYPGETRCRVNHSTSTRVCIYVYSM